MQKQLCNKVVDCLNKCMHDDASNIFNLYLEAVEEQPTMTTDEQGNKQWRLHGKLHRVDGPATENANGTKVWRQHGKMHRDNGPAFEGVDGGKEWYWHGMLHRQDGPAVEWADGRKAWYLYGIFYKTAEQWAEAVLKQRNESHDDAAVHAFLRTILRKDIEAAL